MIDIIRTGFVMEKDKAEHDQIVRMTRQDLGAVGIVETLLADQIAQCAWAIRNIERCEAHTAQELITAHDDKIYDWWANELEGWRVHTSYDRAENYITARQSDIKNLRVLGGLAKRGNDEVLDGRQVVSALHDICFWNETDKYDYRCEHPTIDIMDEMIRVPGEKALYREDDETIYENWTVKRAKKSLKFLQKVYEMKVNDLIEHAICWNEDRMSTVRRFLRGAQAEKARLEETKVKVYDEIKKANEPYRRQKQAMTSKMLDLSTQLSTIQAKRKGEIAASTPVITIEAPAQSNKTSYSESVGLLDLASELGNMMTGLAKA